jgi:hypothetical protein
MRGELQISAARSPFRRAGLAWSTPEPVLVDIRALDGARLLALVKEPVLTVKIGQEDGSFKPFPALDETVTIAVMQEMIDDLAAQLPPIGADAAPAAASLEQQLIDAKESSDRQAGVLEAIRAQLEAGGFTSVEQLISLHNNRFAFCEDVKAATAAAGFEKFADLVADRATKVTELSAAQDMIAALAKERDGATSRVIELEREVAELTASATKAPKPKPAGTDKKS